MECSFSCQFCHSKFNKLYLYKKHMFSKSHHQNLKGVFPNDEVKSCAKGLPHIIFVDPAQTHHIKHPIVGLSAVTLCFSPESKTSFYLCHICEEKCWLGDILRHLFSLDHYINFINCNHPNAMSFSWIPNTDVTKFLSHELMKISNKGCEELQLLHLPKNLLEKLKLSTYSEVMLTFGENEKLLQLIQALKPERVTIQTYQKDINRKHPLLGMQHLVECICVGPGEKRYYLCTLCSLTVGAHAIIKHVLSFDHIFWYFKKWHPSTLLSKECYTEHTPSFESMMLDFSKQTEEMHRTSNIDMKQVSLEPAEFKSINFKSYAEALKTLESIKKCSLKTDIKPGKKLEHHAEMLPYNPRCSVHCQDCRVTLKNISHYLRHLSNASHQKMMWRVFDAEGGYKDRAHFYLGLHSYVMECLKKKQPVIGAALIVSCITTEVEADPFYMCFACQESVRQTLLESHLKSRKHVVYTLLYENPWRLHFGWKNLQDDQVLMSKAWEEEKERRPTEIVLKVLDVPFSVFLRITPPTFEMVMDGLQQQHNVLKNEVPLCETYSKLQQNEPFPLLGMHFLVMYDLLEKGPDSPEAGFLCLLCERRLSNYECHDHVFSHEHVSKFLDCFHPGSLKSDTDAETLLDLAKQAAKIHKRSDIQVVYLSYPIEEPYSYLQATRIVATLTSRQKNRKLKPPIRPERKLVPTVTLKVEQDVRDDGQKNSSSTVCVKNIKTETPSPSEKDSASQRKEISQTEKKNSADDVCSGMKQEPEAADTKEPTGEKKSCHNESKDHGAETGIEKSGKDVPTQSKNYKEMERKRPHSVSEMSQEDPCPTGDAGREMGEICHKRRRLTSRGESCEEAPKISGIKIKEEKKDKAFKAATDKGLSALLKCCCHPHEPVYLCESCSLKISDKDIVSHLTGCDHHKVHLMNVDVNEDIYNNISKQSFESAIRAVRALQTEQDGGCELPSSSASPCMKTVDASIDRHDDYTNDNLTVVKMEIDPDESALFTATPKHTPASSQQPGTTCISNASVSSTKPTAESEAVCRTGVALRETATPSNKAPPQQTESRVVREASCKTTPLSKSKNVPKPQPHQSETKASPQMPSVTGAKKTKTTVKPENVETSAKTARVRNSVEPNAPHCHKSNNPAAAPTQATGTTVRPEHKKPPPEPSQTCTSKTKPSEGLPKVGLNELIVVLCEGKQQVYCKLCSVKLTNSSDYHLVSLDHWKKYVKTKYPEWTANSSEMEKKLNEIATPLAEAEKKLGPRRPQIVKVKKDLYEKLAHLPEDEAVRHVKAISQSNLRVSSASPVDAASASPCDVSSSDDGINMEHSEMSELSSTNLSAVENKNQHQILSVQRQEMKSNLKVEPDLAAGGPVRRQSSKSDETQCDLIQDELEIEEIAETAPLTNFEQDFEVQTHTEVVPAVQSSDVTMEKPQVLAEPADTDSESDAFAESPNGETYDHRPQGWKSEISQDSQKLPGDTPKALPVKFSCSEPLSVAAAGNSKGQNQLKHSQKMKHVLKHYPGPEEHSASRTFFKTPTGRRIQGSGSDSNLSIFLKTKGLDSDPIIGQDYVLECRGIALETFFLCKCCEKTISHRNICQHIVGFNHQLEYMRREYPQFLNKFWDDEDLPFEKKLELLKKVSWKLSKRERDRPEVITLRKEMHEWVRTAPFNEALRILQNITNADKSKREEMAQDIKSDHKHAIFVPQSQRPDEGPSLKESLSTEMPSAQRVDQYQRSDNESRQTQEPLLERTATVSGLEFKEELTSPLDVSCSSPKDDSVASPLANRFSCCSPQETCSKLPVQSEFTPLVQDQWSALSLHMKQEEEHSETPCSSTVNPNVSQTLSVPPRDECLPSRKRPADISVETLLTACTSNPLEDPLPAKSTSNQQLPLSDPTSGSVSQSASVHSAAVPIPLSHHDENKSAVDWALFAHLITMLKGSKFQVASRVETFDSYADSSSESVETRSDSHCTTVKSELPVDKTRYNSECQLVKATVKTPPSSSSSFESMSLPGNHAGTGCESQSVCPSGSSANILCSSDQLMTGNPTEVEAASAASCTATTAEPQDLQHPQSVPNQSLFENMEQFKPSCPADTSHNTGQILQPDVDSETDSKGAVQLPISTIVTNRATQKFMRSYQEHHTEVNSVSFPTVPTASPTGFLVPSAGYELYSHIPYIASGQPGYAPSEAILGHTTADNPHVYNGTLNPNESYTAGTIYPPGFCPQLTVSHSSWQLLGEAVVQPGWVCLNTMQYYPSVMRR